MKLIGETQVDAVMAIPLHRNKERFLSDFKAWVNEITQETRTWIAAFDLQGTVATPEQIDALIMPRVADWLSRQPDTDDYS